MSTPTPAAPVATTEEQLAELRDCMNKMAKKIEAIGEKNEKSEDFSAKIKWGVGTGLVLVLVIVLGFVFKKDTTPPSAAPVATSEAEMAIRAELESSKAQLAELAAAAEAKAKADAEASVEAAKKAEADDLRQEMSSLKEEFMAAIAAATSSNATAQLEPETPTTTGGVKTLTDQLTPEQAVQLMGAPGSDPKVVVASKEQAPNGDIMVNTLTQQGEVWLPNVNEGRSVSVDYKPEDIGQEIPIGYFRFAPQALQIYQQHGLRAVISNTRVGSGKLLVVFTK